MHAPGLSCSDSTGSTLVVTSSGMATAASEGSVTRVETGLRKSGLAGSDSSDDVTRVSGMVREDTCTGAVVDATWLMGN